MSSLDVTPTLCEYQTGFPYGSDEYFHIIIIIYIDMRPFTPSANPLTENSQVLGKLVLRKADLTLTSSLWFSICPFRNPNIHLKIQCLVLFTAWPQKLCEKETIIPHVIACLLSYGP